VKKNTIESHKFTASQLRVLHTLVECAIELKEPSGIPGHRPCVLFNATDWEGQEKEDLELLTKKGLVAVGLVDIKVRKSIVSVLLSDQAWSAYSAMIRSTAEIHLRALPDKPTLAGQEELDLTVA
jgi:hypothetical protein